MNMKTVAAKVGEVAVILAIVGVVSTYWVNTEVERRMKELVPNAAVNPVVVANKVDIENLETTVARIEAKVDAFSTEFLAYLARQSQN